MNPYSQFYKVILRDASFKISAGLLSLFTVWWAALHLFDLPYGFTIAWAVSYQITALFGSIVGFLIARKWGGFQSTMGRAILMFSFGLLCQWFAQAAGNYYVWYIGTVPYPSLSDIGAFGALIFYALGVIFLAKTSGAHLSLRSYRGKLIAALVPLLFLSASFAFFVRSHEYDWSQPLITFLDIGYPLGEAFYVSMAILAYLLSQKVLGGVMKVPTLFFIAALITEFIADFLFLYHARSGDFVVGGFNDYLFVVAYSLMAISLIQLGVVSRWIKET